MKIAPNLNFTVVQPTIKSLASFVQMIKNVYQNFSQAFNGHIGFGDGTNHDNVDGTWINVTAPAVANTDFTVNHDLNRLPAGYWVMEKDRACDVYTGSVAATATQLTLRASVASAVLRLFIVGLLLCFITTRSEAQGANHTNIAFKNTTVAGSTGIGGGTVLQAINGAIITVCNGSTLPTTGNTCTGLASIFSNRALTLTLSNPTNADINGNYTFWAAPGPYVVSVASSGLTTYSYAITLACNPTDACTISGAATLTSPTLTTPTINGFLISNSPAQVGAQTSASTNFGVNLTTQTILASVPNTGVVNITVNTVVTLVGVGCSAVSNTAAPTVSWTAPGGSVLTAPYSGLNQTGNGTIDVGASSSNDALQIVAKVGTSITYTVTSTLGSTGCTTTPQYTVFAKATY